jgi:hypothetical protein
VFSPQQALKPPHQDPLPNKKALNHLNKNGQRLAGYVANWEVTPFGSNFPVGGD